MQFRSTASNLDEQLQVHIVALWGSAVGLLAAPTRDQILALQLCEQGQQSIGLAASPTLHSVWRLTLRACTLSAHPHHGIGPTLPGKGRDLPIAILLLVPQPYSEPSKVSSLRLPGTRLTRVGQICWAHQNAQ